MTVPVLAGLKPGGERFIEATEARPVKESSGIEKTIKKSSSGEHDAQINISPGLGCAFRVGQRRDQVRNPKNCQGQGGTAEMNNVRFLRQDHTGQSHPEAPEIVVCSQFPETEEAEHKKLREEDQPDLVD